MQDDGTIKAPRRKKVKRQRRERGRLYLSQAPSGIWRMRGTVAGHEINESTGTHSEDHAKRIRDDREKRLLDEKVFGKASVATFAEAVTDYKRLKGKNSVTRHLDPLVKKFGERRLVDISPQDILDYALDTLPSAKNTTRNANIVNPFITVMRNAASSEKCSPKAWKRFEDDSEKVLGPPPGWIEGFLNGCDNPRMWACVAFMTTTATRTIEALRCRWRDFDDAAGTLTFTMKNGKVAVVELTGQVTQAIAALPRGKPDDVIFGWSDTNSFNKSLARQCEYLRMESMSGHRVGRHAFAERMLAAGYDCHTVASMGRWEDVGVFVDRYGHLEKKKLAATMKEHGAALLKPKLKIVGGN